jgi:eukaryotic-like serine/threonine-protein kinase
MRGELDDTQHKPDTEGYARDRAARPADPSSSGVPTIGEVIAAKYRVDRILGSGGMGVVVAVTHLQLNERYALKCLLPGSASDPETVARFIREARAAVRIKSEHIAHVSDVGTLASGAPYILMEHLTGRDLSDVVKDQGPLPTHEAIEYVLQACAGIAEAHALGIIHRDLKPSNLFLTQRLDGAPLIKVLDFGIAKTMEERGPESPPALTQTASAFGSPAYMSPEQLRSTKKVDVRTDVWSLGVILYELLTGELPFTEETTSGLLAAIAADEPNKLRDIRPDVSEAIEAIVLACLQKDVRRRLQSVSELATALEPFRSDTSVVSVGRIRRLSTPSTRVLVSAIPVQARSAPAASVAVRRPSRAVVAFLVGAALTVVVAIGVIVLRRPGSSPSPDVDPLPPAAPASIAAAAAPLPVRSVVTAPVISEPAVVTTPAATTHTSPVHPRASTTQPRARLGGAVPDSSATPPKAPLDPLDSSH